MSTPDQIERSIRKALPAEAQAPTPELARLLSGLLSGETAPEALRELLATEPGVARTLASLIGQQIGAGPSALSFGAGNQIGDVTIRDVAGGDLINLTLNIYQGEPNAEPPQANAPATPLDAAAETAQPQEPPPPLTAAKIEQIWRRARSAYLQKRWAQAIALFEQIAAINPNHRDIQVKLAEAQRQLGRQERYAGLQALRAADDWRAVLDALKELGADRLGQQDRDGFWAWAEVRGQQAAAYDAAFAAADRGDWAGAMATLDALLAESPDDTDAQELREHVRGELEAQARQRDRAALTNIIGRVQTEDYDEAMRQLEVAIDDPEHRFAAALLAAQLAEATALPVTARIQAGHLAGLAGDPRTPVTPDEWRREQGRLGDSLDAHDWDDLPPPYWCRIMAGTYRIGGWEAGQASADINLPMFWVARLPVTVAQYSAFLTKGDRKEQQPYFWGAHPWDAPGQPVIGVSWRQALAYCGWLTDELGSALPAGYCIRLPSEAEWETAAAAREQGQRYRHPWGEEAPTADLAIFQASGLTHPAPVGCCPAGAAACGALDMAGNVWEATVSDYQGYPAKSHVLLKDVTCGQPAWRGGGWQDDSAVIGCGARVRSHFDYINCLGFRVMLAPPLG